MKQKKRILYIHLKGTSVYKISTPCHIYVRFLKQDPDSAFSEKCGKIEARLERIEEKLDTMNGSLNDHKLKTNVDITRINARAGAYGAAGSGGVLTIFFGLSTYLKKRNGKNGR